MSERSKTEGRATPRRVLPRRLALAIGLGLALGLDAGCGGAAMQPEVVEPTLELGADRPDALHAELLERERELHGALARPEADCGGACALSERICALEARICALSEAHPADAETRALCDDARPRCVSARDRVAERCECPAPEDPQGT